MLPILRLVLPIILPAWRFFKTVEASPRIEYTVGDHWTPLYPRPPQVSPVQMLGQLFWNPHGNEALFMTSCAERQQEAPNDHNIAEIQSRIRRDTGPWAAPTQMRFRIVFVWEEAGARQREVTYVSPLFKAAP